MGPSPLPEADCAKGETLNTFEDAFRWFKVSENSIACIVRRRWPDGVVRCPVCGSRDVRYLASRELWECRMRHPRAQFSVRVGTIFEDSHIALGLWLTAIWMVANLSQLSSHEVARRLGITQKSAWSMLRRIKCATKAAESKRLSQPGTSVRERQSGSFSE
jgi:hypothetical protein